MGRQTLWGMADTEKCGGGKKCIGIYKQNTKLHPSTNPETALQVCESGLLG